MSQRAERILNLHEAPVLLERRRDVALPAPKSFDLRLVVPADPDALAAIRHAMGGVAGALGMDAMGIADLRLALTEVCSAAVRGNRAGDDDAELEVVAELVGGRLRVTVRDGLALAPGTGPDGFPLPLVAALTDSLEMRRIPSGSEVVMTFALER